MCEDLQVPTLIQIDGMAARIRMVIALAALCALMSCTGAAKSEQHPGESVLRFVPQSDLEILDPVWSTAMITRNHGLLIYDTLFGMDTKGKITPQMVDKYEVSPDKKVWTFTLRPTSSFTMVSR